MLTRHYIQFAQAKVLEALPRALSNNTADVNSSKKPLKNALRHRSNIAEAQDLA
jgi:hypothetical protein